MRRWRATSLGCKVCTRLRAGAIIHSVFRRVCNLVTHDGLLVSLVAPSIGNGPANLIVDVPDNIDFRSQGFETGQPAYLVGQVLIVGPATVALDSAMVWSAVQKERDLSPEGLHTALMLLRTCMGSPPVGGDSLLCGAAEARVVEFIDAATLLDEEARIEMANSLVGLGPGLTPAGDDFLAGYVAGLDCLGTSWSTRERLALAATLDLWATSWLSGQKLSLVLAGELDEWLANATTAVLSGDPRAYVAIQKLRAIGHTSGWFTIAGIFTAARLALTYLCEQTKDPLFTNLSV